MIFTANAKEIKVVDAVSNIKDGEVAIAIIFDKPVDPKFFYDDFISISSVGNFYYKKGVVDPSRHIIYYTGFPSGRKFKINVWQGFQGANGTELESDFLKQLVTPTLKPDAWFSESGILSIQPNNRGITVNVSNRDNITVNYYAVPFSASKPFTADLSEAKNILTPSDLVTVKSYKTSSLHKQTLFSVTPPDELFKTKGLYFAAIAGDEGITSTAAFLVNEMNIHARYYPLSNQKNFAVWVRSNGEPAAGAAVRIFAKNSADSALSAVTDAGGKAEFDIHSINNIEGIDSITAVKDNLSAVLLPNEAFNMADFDAAGDVYSDLSVFIYGAKDIYLKGETVRYHIIARDNDGKPAEAENAEITVTRPDGTTAGSVSTLNKELGYSEFSIKLDDKTPAGDWKLSVKIADTVSEHLFTVKETPKVKLSLQNGKNSYLTDNLSALNLSLEGVNLDNLSPASGILKGFYSIKTVSQIKGYEDYNFGMDSAAKTYTIAPKNLSSGKSAFSLVDTPVPEDSFSPVLVEYNIQLFEKNIETAQFSSRSIYFPAGEALGIKHVTEGGETVFNLVNIDTGGNPKKSKFSCLLLKEEKDVSWNYSEEEGWKAEYSSMAYPLVEQFFDSAAPKEIRFKTPPGSYRLEIKNLATSAVRVFSFNTDKTAKFADNRIQISLDKESYLPGEALKAAVTAPFDGNALLLVEDSEGILRSQLFNITNGKGEINFPINPRWNRRDIYISALQYNNQTKAKNGANLAFGIVHLPISRNNEIELKIEHPERVAGGSDFEIVVKADGNYKDASVTLSLVNKDLSIGSATPETFFSRKLAYLPVIFDNSETLFKSEGKSSRLQAEAPERPNLPADYKPIAVFTKPMSFDELGEARFKLRIPDFKGELRLTALAIGKDAFGSERTFLRVNDAVTGIYMPVDGIRIINPIDFVIEMENLK
jgi:uncharacterized protein YfaS (alpha-2-macroglobulin family)